MTKANHVIRILAAAVVILLMALFSATKSHAVPAQPGSPAASSGSETAAASEDVSVPHACRSMTFDKVTLSDLRKSTTGPTNRKNVKSAKSGTAELPTVIIVVGFANIPYENDFDWGDRIFAGPRSLSQYYSDMSLGQFTFTPVQETSKHGTGGNTNTADAENDGIIHVTLTLNHDDWTSTQEFPADRYPHDKSEMAALSAAITAASDYIDFSAYDSNNDGEIDNSELAVGFVVAGYEASTGETDGNNGLALWSHAWSFDSAADLYRSEGSQYTMPDAPVVDGVSVDGFIAFAELCYNNGSFRQAPISILAHELGHYLGLPDLYDTTGISHYPWHGYTPGYLSLMDNGSWGYDESGNFSPYSLDIWSRITLGWIEPQVINNPVDSSTASVEGSLLSGVGPKALKICTSRDNEYYLVENRRIEGWDATLCSTIEYWANESGLYYDGCEDGGIILWHIDDNIYELYKDTNSVNDSDHHPAVTPLYLEYFEGRYEPYGEKLTGCVFFNSETYSEGLYLPLYPGKEVLNTRYDIPQERTDSWCIRLTFTDNAGPTISVRFTYNHVWDAGKITKPATAQAAGVKTFTCDSCGATKTEAIPKLDPYSQMGTDGTPVGPGASMEAAEKAITSADSEEGPAGTRFAPLCLKSTKQTKTSVKLTWKKVTNAKTYVIYGNKCGKDYKMKRLGTATGTSKTFKKVAGAKVKKGTYYKFIVVALDSSNNVISTSKTCHVGTSGGKAGNPTKVTTKAKKNKVTVKVKKTFKLAGKQTGKSVKKHRTVKYESSKPTVATVSSKGVIKGVKKGKCTVYAYTQNGVHVKVKVTVK